MSNLWIQTYTGKKFDLDNLNPDDIDIIDIAHALSNICRFNGHCNTFYSVAQHCIEVSKTVIPEYKLQALLHDAAEAYIGDLTSPLRRMDCMTGFNRLHNKIRDVIYSKFNINVSFEADAMINAADIYMLLCEKEVLFDNQLDWGWRLPELMRVVNIKPLNSKTAKESFLSYYEKYKV